MNNSDNTFGIIGSLSSNSIESNNGKEGLGLDKDKENDIYNSFSLDKLKADKNPIGREKNIKQVSEEIFKYLSMGIDTPGILKTLDMLGIELDKIILNVDTYFFQTPAKKQAGVCFLDLYFRSVRGKITLKPSTIDYIIEHTPKESLNQTLLYILACNPRVLKSEISIQAVEKLVLALSPTTNFSKSGSLSFIYEYIKGVDCFAKNETEIFTDKQLIKIISTSKLDSEISTYVGLEKHSMLSYAISRAALRNLKASPLVLDALIYAMPIDEASLLMATVQGIAKGIEGIGILNKIDKKRNTNWAALLKPRHLREMSFDSIMYLFKHKNLQLNEENMAELEKRYDYNKLKEELTNVGALKEKWEIYRQIKNNENSGSIESKAKTKANKI